MKIKCFKAVPEHRITSYNVCYTKLLRVEVSFAPKITVGKAGSGMHIHLMLEKDGRNVMIENGKLSDTAKKMIAGILDLSKGLTAFGNTIPTSYLRLVPHQEAPTNICWGVITSYSIHYTKLYEDQYRYLLYRYRTCILREASSSSDRRPISLPSQSS